MGRRHFAVARDAHTNPKVCLALLKEQTNFLTRKPRDWHFIDDTSPCPYHFSSEEIAQHRREGGGFNENADFWDNLEGFVDRSGYTSHEGFPDAVACFTELRRVGLDTLIGEERESFELHTRWMLGRQESDE